SPEGGQEKSQNTVKNVFVFLKMGKKGCRGRLVGKRNTSCPGGGGGGGAETRKIICPPGEWPLPKGPLPLCVQKIKKQNP
ncbi:hypothetical protein NDU88_003575, partial [Pleurodeles waltl]